MYPQMQFHVVSCGENLHMIQRYPTFRSLTVALCTTGAVFSPTGSWWLSFFWPSSFNAVGIQNGECDRETERDRDRERALCEL